MAVAKLNKSKKSVFFITDEGEQFITSVNFLTGLLSGKSKHGFILLTRLPFNCAPDRFQKSPLYDPTGVFNGNAAKTLEPTSQNTDIYSKEGKAAITQPELFSDKMVWDDDNEI